MLWIALFLAAVLAFGFLWPDKVSLSRKVEIAAPPEKVFAHIADFNKWDAWSPWASLDPDAEMKIEGEGLGQRMAWTSQKREVGEGAQEIVELDPPSRLVTALEFPDMGRARATFDVTPAGEGTSVEWRLDTNMREGVPLMRQPMATMFGFFMDKMVGPQYEKGLASLKSVVESDA